MKEYVANGGTLVIDPAESTIPPDEFLAEFGNSLSAICIVAKSESGSTYYASNTAPKDPQHGEIFYHFAKLAANMGIPVYALIHGNLDGFFSRDPNFQMNKSGGNPIEGYVCPNQETYWAYLAEICAEITKKTQVSGIIIRDALYINQSACFCDNCRRNFSSTVKIDRDYSYEQIVKVPKIHASWQKSRINAIKGMVSYIVQRVHKERQIDVLVEILVDPETGYFDGSASHFGVDLEALSEITPHVLLHLHPFTAFPSSTNEITQLLNNMGPILNRIGTMRNSLFLWEPTDVSFQLALQLKETLGSSNIFFTEKKPSSYRNRRSLHLGLGL